GFQEVDEATLVDSDEACLVLRGPTRRILALERCKERTQHIVVLLIAFILAAVVVRQECAAPKLETRSVQRGRDNRLLVCCCAFELLQECRFSVPRIAGDDNERELA